MVEQQLLNNSSIGSNNSIIGSSTSNNGMGQIPFTDTKDLFVQEHEIFQSKTNEFITIQYFCNKEGEPTYFPDRTLAALFQVNLSTLRGRFNRLTKKHEGFRLLISEKSKARLSSLHFINWGSHQQQQNPTSPTPSPNNTSLVMSNTPVSQSPSSSSQSLDDSYNNSNNNNNNSNSSSNNSSSGSSVNNTGVSSLHGLVALNHIYLVNVALSEWIANNHERLGTSLKEIETNLTKANLTFNRVADVITILPKCLNNGNSTTIGTNNNNNTSSNNTNTLNIQSPISSASTSPTLSPTQNMRSSLNNLSIPETHLYSTLSHLNSSPDNFKKSNPINLPIPKQQQQQYYLQQQQQLQQTLILQNQLHQQQLYIQQLQQQQQMNNNNNNSKKRSFDNFSEFNPLLSLSLLSKKVKSLNELNSDDSDIDYCLSPNSQLPIIVDQSIQKLPCSPSKSNNIVTQNNNNNNSINNNCYHDDSIKQSCQYIFCKLYDTNSYKLVDISQIKSFSSFRETLSSIFGIYAFILSFQDSLNSAIQLNEQDEDRWIDFCSLVNRVTLKPYHCQKPDLKNILCN